ncbi:RNA polymerase II mediator complex subunit [Actinomortierella wolfii]|nr:RNA polymerase II mediator complex subunit [Actinomortierella wolfii]KAG0242142.1 RNA polymerase II mediator complex subunit [Actinomortierella wolfii]
MDRLTQLQDAIDKLALLFFSSVDHLTRNAPLLPLNNDIPIVTTDTAQELAQDISRHAKALEMLIDNLPGIGQTPEDQLRDLEELAQQNAIANQEYDEAVSEAKALLQEITFALRNIALDQSQPA